MMNSKQPRALAVLFATEFWERYGFYVIQSILVLFLISRRHFSDSDSYRIIAAFTALAYGSPVFGGWLADKILGYRRAIYLGSFMLAFGYLGLVLDSIIYTYLSLGMIVLGTGLFKPTISTFLGDFYSKDDPKRDSGFTLFYVGINLGGGLATFTSGLVKQYFGWNMCFILASFGLLIAVIIFHYWRHRFDDKGLKPSAIDNGTVMTMLKKPIILIGLFVLAWLGFSLLLDSKTASEWFFMIVSIVLFIGFCYFTVKSSPAYRSRMIVLLLLIIASVVFWALYFQQFMSLTLYISRDVDHQFLGFKITTMMFLSMQQFFVITLGFMFSKMWTFLNKKYDSSGVPQKFALGLIILGLAFLLLYQSTHYLDKNQLVSSNWILYAYMLIAVAELFLSPIGLSMITLLAPKELSGMAMGAWFFSLGMGGYLSGTLAQMTALPHGITSISYRNHYYGHAFYVYFLISMACGLILLCLAPKLNRMIKASLQANGA